MADKIEFIKGKGPNRYKILVDTKNGQNVGMDISRKDMKSAFYNIKNLLEAQMELSEPANIAGTKKVVVNQVTDESVLEYLLNQEPQLVSEIILSYRNNIAEVPDHSPETKRKVQKFICGVDEEDMPEVGKLKPRKQRKKIKWKKIFQWIGILALAGIAAGHALGHYDIIDVYFNVIEYIKVNFGK